MILVTGATGNTGSIVVRELVASRGHDAVMALVRTASDTRELEALGVAIHRCDLDDPATWRDQVTAGDVFVGISNLRHCDTMLPHLAAAGVLRAHCVTTTAVFSNYHSYGALYREIEARLCAAPLPVSILRPSMIYGNARDHNMHRLIEVMRRTPVFPVFGDGQALMQPVFVDDLARGIVAAVDREATGAYNLAGPAAITYNAILSEIAVALHRQVRQVHLNHGLAAGLVRALERVPGFPVRHEQVMRLAEDKTFDIGPARRDLGFAPRDFADGIRTEIARLAAGATVGPVAS